MNPDLRAELPPLAVPETQAPNTGDQRSPELSHAAVPERGNSANQAMPVSNSAQTPPEAEPATDPITSGVSQQISTTPLPAVADDADLIEKEWVDKAKQIVEQTKEDPYLQNKEIHKVKADYLKKRYNKDMNLVDD